ncbi:MAG TPA: DUF892 family protein [Bryobacteraceae bacterium]
MAQLKQLLVDELQGMLDAETQLVDALPKMAKAAKAPKVKEAFEKHLMETEEHVFRLKSALEMLGEEEAPRACKAMQALISEGDETIQKGNSMDPLGADLALIAAAQKVEHHEIACYGTARTLARQLGQIEVAKLLSRTLGEEESADFLLSAAGDPLLQQAALEDMGARTNLHDTGKAAPQKKRSSRQAASAVA